MEFTEEEVRQKLYELGYVNVPQSKLIEFMKGQTLIAVCNRNLEELVKHEQSTDSYTTMTGASDSEDSQYFENRRPFQDVSKQQRHHPVAFFKEKEYRKLRQVSYDKENVDCHNPPESSELLSSTAASFSESDTVTYQPRYNSWIEQKEHSGSNVQRKVARKKNGQTHIFDETFTDNESIISDITDLEDRLRNMPLQKERYNSSNDLSESSKASSSRYFRKYTEAETAASALPAFIRPSTSHPHTKRLRKCDPVSRFHQFKEEWKVNKVPGESKRSSLRWNVREQMINSEVFEKPRHHFTKNKYVVPTEKKRQTLRWQVRSALAKV